MIFRSLTLLMFVFLAACTKKTDAPPKEKQLISEEIAYSADSVTMKGFLVYDGEQKGKRPGVLVVHEWWGHNDYARKRAKMLAEMGYIAFAVDMYGDGKTADHPDDAGKFAGEVMKRGPGAKDRFMKAMEILKANPNCDPDKIAAIGYCFGGSTVLNMARQGVGLKGVVSFHGGLNTDTPAKKGEVKARVLACIGAADPFIPREQADAFKKEMDDAGVNYIFKSYEGAMHSFTNPGADELGKKFNLPLAYNAAADTSSWNEMKAFFGEIFK